MAQAPERTEQTEGMPPNRAPERSSRRGKRLLRGWRWQADAWFLLGIVALTVVTALALSVAGGVASSTTTAQRGQPPASRTPAPKVTATPRSGLVATTRPASATVFTLPNTNAGLMLPALDGQNNVWTGEMSVNKLAEINTHGGPVREWTPPHGKYTIMQTQVDSHGMVWFTEEAANYIGRFDPATQTFKTYPLGTVNGKLVGPQAMVFDQQGTIWFTGIIGGTIGRLDPITGVSREWQVPAPTGISEAIPYVLALTPDGRVWYGDLTGGTIGYLVPSTGQFKQIPLSDPQANVFSMAADRSGHIWFSELQSARLGSVDTSTLKVTERAVPHTLGDPAQVYGVTVAPTGDVWLASAGANALVRYSPKTDSWVFYQLATPQSIPYGVTVDATGHIWFTTEGDHANYVGMLTP